MSVQSQINRINNNILAAFNAIGNKGGKVPEDKISVNLASAINSIPNEGGSTKPKAIDIVVANFTGYSEMEVIRL